MKNSKQIISDKIRGKVYTPPDIVKHILNLSNYYGRNILKKHVIDNSCGAGAFLIEIVERYIKESIKIKLTKDDIKSDLETYIHGIEINKEEKEICTKNLDKIAIKYSLKDIQWDILCDNSLLINKYDGKMDFVIGNPPYVRIHNIKNEGKFIKNYSFTQNGMTDLFIVFYEIGLKMLNDNGILGYITPSSLFNSLACKDIRKYFIAKKLLTKIVDFKHYQLFNATTYTTIIILSKNNKISQSEYYEYNPTESALKFIDILNYNTFYINNNFYFASKEDLTKLRKILNHKNNNKLIEVKNGFATLNDKFFIGNFGFNNWTIPIIKASTGKEQSCIFPYKNGKLASYEELTKDINIKEYFESNKEKLLKRSLEKGASWYGYGRSQGINDVYKNKYSINTIIKDFKSIKLVPCPAGVGVYSGLYILTKLPEEKIKKIILNNKFIKYIKLLGKYKNGGYYTYSSSDLKKYIEYQLKDEDNQIEQLKIFGNN